MDTSAADSLLATLVYPTITGIVSGLVVNVVSNYSLKETTSTDVKYQKKIIIQENTKTYETMTEFFNYKIFNSRLITLVFSFYILYAFIFLPLLWKIQPLLGSPRTIYFSQARVIGHFLPDTIINNHFFQWPLIMVTLILYYPLLFVTDIIIQPIVLFLITKMNAPVTQKFIQIFQITIFTIFSAFIGICVVYCYYDINLKDATTIGLGALLLLFLPLLGQKKN